MLSSSSFRLGRPGRAAAALPWLFCTALIAGIPAQDPGGIPECKEMKTTASGLQYGVLTAGREEPPPAANDVVIVHYTGWLTNGTRFDSSRDRDEPFRTPLDGVIAGWIEGLQLMAPGARYKFVIPPALGYGDRVVSSIPANSTLVFDVELLEVIRMPRFRPADQDKQQTRESGLKYEVVKKGTGPACSPGDGVSFRFALFSVDGELKVCTEQNNQRLSGTRDTLAFPFLQELMDLMQVGDVFRVEVPAELCQKDRPIAGLPPGATTVWEIELLGSTGVPKFQASDPKNLKTTDSGLQYEVIKEGTGKRPTATSRVLAHYTGWFTDGKVFDSSYRRGLPSEFGLDQVIKGWTEGLQLMQEGAEYQFVIPSELAYGSEGRGEAIPPNATLVFRVVLLEVK